MNVCMDRATGQQAIHNSSRSIQPLTLTQAGVAGLAHALAGIGAGRRGRGGGVPGVTGHASVDANVLFRSCLRCVRSREGQHRDQAQQQLFAGAEHDRCVGRTSWMPVSEPVSFVCKKNGDGWDTRVHCCEMSPHVVQSSVTRDPSAHSIKSMENAIIEIASHDVSESIRLPCTMSPRGS